MKKICVIISSRASYSRFRTALREINKCAKLMVVLTASASEDSRGNVKQQLLMDEIKNIHVINSLYKESTLAAQVKTTAETMYQLSDYFEKNTPEVVVTIADRYETIATAIAASYMNIILVHIQGGEVTGNIDERVRHAVTKLSDFHLVSNNRAKQYLIKMGEEEKRIKVTGCPSCDIADYVKKHKKDIQEIIDKYKLNRIIGNEHLVDVIEENFYVVIFHSTTNEIDTLNKRLQALVNALEKAEKTILWVQGNTDAGASEIEKYIARDSRVCCIPPMESEDFLQLLVHSAGIIGNSSVAIRECSYLAVPAVNIGSRQFGRERGNNVIDVGDSEQEVLAGINKLEHMVCSPSCLYGDGKAGSRIAEYILGYALAPKKNITYVEEL